jgi:hypothetical protein
MSKKFEKFCFVITAYQQVELVKRNVTRIRREYPELICNAQIIVVSTSQEDMFSSVLSGYKDVHFIHFNNSPGSEKADFQSRKNSNNSFLNWRHEFLPPRIMISIQKGLEKALSLGMDSALHLHSDTYWEPKKINGLLDEIQEINEILFKGDLSYPNEIASQRKKITPKGIHFQPEGLLFNINFCKEYGFMNFENIWKDRNFKSHNFGSIEALIGQWAIYCLSNHKKNILNFSDVIPCIYKKLVKVRTVRGYHGKFKSGLINLNLSQEIVRSFSEEDLIPVPKNIFQKIKGYIFNYEP